MAQQASAFVATCSQCDHCGDPLRVKGQQTRTFHTLSALVTLPAVVTGVVVLWALAPVVR